MNQKLFNEIKRIDKIAYRSTPRAVCKLGEEYGELVQAINIAIGIKKKGGLSSDDILNKIKEESADTIQNILLLVGRFGITYDELVSTLGYKNKVWKKKYGKKKNKRQLCI